MPVNPTPEELKIVKAFRAGFTTYLEKPSFGEAKTLEEHFVECFRPHIGDLLARERQYAELVAAAEQMDAVVEQPVAEGESTTKRFIHAAQRLRAALAALSPVSPAEPTKGEQT